MQSELPPKRLIRVTGETRLSHVLEAIPGALEYVVSLRPHDFQRLNNPMMRKYMSPRIKLNRVAAMAGVPVEAIIEKMAALGGDSVEAPAGMEAVPAPRSPEAPPLWMKDVDEDSIHWVNLLPIDDVLGDPIPPISTAVRRMPPGSALAIRHRWEPQPLYDLWVKMGIEWYSREAAPDEWNVFVHKPAAFPPADPNETVMVDLRHLPAAEGPPRAVAMFEQLPPGHAVEVWGIPGTLDPVRRLFEATHPGEFEWEEQPGSDDKQVVLVRAPESSRT
ncbi:MAG TPA: hypothetical protein VFJ58_19670 [Armatimonadota bacterium]|nr:hypothetical protein [Armatimonadota bacterium]